MDAALAHVHNKGFSIPALTEGARDCGFESPHAIHGLFENGEMALLEHLCRRQTDEMREEMMELDIEGMTPLERIRTAIRRRLRKNADFMDIWPSAMALGASPSNLQHTYSHIAYTIDTIWQIGGVDEQSGLTPKKASLSGVYVSTELFMLSDQSGDFEQTWVFLDRRLDDMLALQALPVEWANKGSAGVNILSSVLQQFGGSRTRPAEGAEASDQAAHTARNLMNLAKDTAGALAKEGLASAATRAASGASSVASAATRAATGASSEAQSMGAGAARAPTSAENKVNDNATDRKQGHPGPTK